MTRLLVRLGACDAFSRYHIRRCAAGAVRHSHHPATAFTSLRVVLGRMDYEAARESLAERIATGEDLDERVVDAIAAVPRHEFVPKRERDRAYEDRPAPIGHGQTVSAPSVVALMTDLLDLSPDDRVLEIGTGCGYHAAVIAEVLGDDGAVYSVDPVERVGDATGRARVARGEKAEHAVRRLVLPADALEEPQLRERADDRLGARLGEVRLRRHRGRGSR